MTTANKIMGRRALLAGIAASGVGVLSSCSSKEPAEPAASGVPDVRKNAATWKPTAVSSYTPNGTEQTGVAAGAPVQKLVPGAKAKGSVAMLGDSLTFQGGKGEKNLTAALSGVGFQKVFWSGSDGRTITGKIANGAPSAEEEATRAKKELGKVDLWVVALITNNRDSTDQEFVAAVKQLMGVIGADQRVLWVNACVSQPTDPVTNKANALLARTLADYDKVTIADWRAHVVASRNPKDWWVPDGTHMTDEGYAQKNRFISQMAASAIG